MTTRSLVPRVAAAIALVVAAGLWFWRDVGDEATKPIAADVPSPQAAADGAHRGAHAEDRDDHRRADDQASGDGHDHADEAPNVDLRLRYFEPPTLRDARTFAGADTPLLVEASCRAHPLMAKSGSAEQRLKSLYAMNARERFPEDVFYRSLIQFWQHEGRYYQLSAIWEIGLPPMYEVKLHRSATPEFGSAVAEEALPDAGSGAMDAAATAAYMTRISDAYAAKGATLGLQILEADWPTADGKGRMRTVLANGRPVSWSFPGGACTYDAGAAALRCRCPSARESDKPGTS